MVIVWREIASLNMMNELFYTNALADFEEVKWEAITS